MWILTILKCICQQCIWIIQQVSEKPYLLSKHFTQIVTYIIKKFDKIQTKIKPFT